MFSSLRNALLLSRPLRLQGRSAAACRLPLSPSWAKLRRFSTNVKPADGIACRPPFLVRVGIVGSSITLATPVFAVAGVFRIWNSVLPKTAEGVVLKRIVSLLIGGGSVTLVYMYVLPFLKCYPDLILPFALSNGVACMFWHGVAEATLGLEALAGGSSAVASALPAVAKEALPKFFLRLPLGGGLLGILTSLTAPLLWPLMTDLCWSQELKTLLLGGNSLTWLLDSYYGVGMAVALPVGALAGASLHYALAPFVLGFAPSRALSWHYTSLPFLGVTTAACLLYYGTARLRGGGVLIDDFMWMPRLDPKTGAPISVNVHTGAV